MRGEGHRAEDGHAPPLSDGAWSGISSGFVFSGVVHARELYFLLVFVFQKLS